MPSTGWWGRAEVRPFYRGGSILWRFGSIFGKAPKPLMAQHNGDQPWTKDSPASSSGTVLVILETSMADCDEHQLRIKQYRLSIAGAVSAKRVTCPGVVLWWFARLGTCQIAGRSRPWKRVWKLCWKLASDQHGSIWMMMLDVLLSVFLGCASRSSMQWAEDVATRFFSDELCRHAHRHLLRVCTWSFVGALSIYWVGCCHCSRRWPLSPCIVVGTKLHQQQQIQCLLSRAPRWHVKIMFDLLCSCCALHAATSFKGQWQSPGIMNAYQHIGILQRIPESISRKGHHRIHLGVLETLQDQASPNRGKRAHCIEPHQNPKHRRCSSRLWWFLGAMVSTRLKVGW